MAQIIDGKGVAAQVRADVAKEVARLRERGVKMCLATASDRSIVEPALRRTGIYDDLDFIFTCSELHTDKNDPYIYNYVRSYMQTPRDQTLVFEDAFHAIRTARQAGFPVAAVYDRTEAENQPAIRRIADFYLETPAQWPKIFSGGAQAGDAVCPSPARMESPLT